MIFRIYGLSSSENSEQIRYIGQTINTLEKRLIMHKSKAKKENNHRACWIRKVLSEGNTIIITLIDEADESNWVEKEKEYIKIFKTLGAGLVNTSDGGESFMLGKKHRPETILKMIESRKGQKRHLHTEETRQKLREATIKQHKEKGHPKGMLGKRHSKASIEKRENTKRLNRIMKLKPKPEK